MRRRCWVGGEREGPRGVSEGPMQAPLDVWALLRMESPPLWGPDLAIQKQPSTWGHSSEAEAQEPRLGWAAFTENTASSL